MEHVPALVSLLPTLMMLIGLAVAYYMYIVDRAAPKALADANPAALPLPAQQVVLRRALRLPVRAAGVLASAALFWKGGDGAIIDGFGPDGVSARVLDVTRNVVRLQSGYVYHYAFAMLIGVAALRHLVSVRGDPLMSGSWILSGAAGPAADRRAADPDPARRKRGDATTTRAGSRCGRR